MALSSRKCRPTLTLHIRVRKSSTVSSLIDVCRPERVLMGPVHAANPFQCPMHLEPNNLYLHRSKFSNNQALYREPMPSIACTRT